MPTISTAEYWTTIRREPFIVGYWRGNDATGETQAADSAARYDLIGVYDDVQIIGPPLIQNDATAGSIATASGRPGFKIPDTSVIELISDLTLEAWIVPRATSQTCQLIGKLNSANTHANPYSLQLSSGALAFGLGNGSGQATLTAGTPAESVPSHVVATSFRGEMTLYLNGAVVGTKALGAQAVADGGQALWIGSEGGSTAIFNGLLSEVALYSGALSARRVQRHYDLAQQVYPDQPHYLGVGPPVLTA